MAFLSVLLVLEAAIVLCGTLLFAWLWQRRTGANWATWLWGGAAFIAAQLVHIPVMPGLTALGKKFPPAPAYAPWINIVILGGTAGLFENVARYLFLRGLIESAVLLLTTVSMAIIIWTYRSEQKENVPPSTAGAE